MFFEHSGLSFRLDFESILVNLSDLHSLMLKQIAADLATEWLVEEIRKDQVEKAVDTDASVRRFLNDGFVEQPAEEFKRMASERFGNG